MDLVAYKNIEDLGAIAQKNGIDVPRLRGYRLMAKQEPITDEEIQRYQEKYDEAPDIGPEETEADVGFTFIQIM